MSLKSRMRNSLLGRATRLGGKQLANYTSIKYSQIMLGTRVGKLLFNILNKGAKAASTGSTGGTGEPSPKAPAAAPKKKKGLWYKLTHMGEIRRDKQRAQAISAQADAHNAANDAKDPAVYTAAGKRTADGSFLQKFKRNHQETAAVEPTDDASAYLDEMHAQQEEALDSGSLSVDAWGNKFSEISSQLAPLYEMLTDDNNPEISGMIDKITVLPDEDTMRINLKPATESVADNTFELSPLTFAATGIYLTKGKSPSKLATGLVEGIGAGKDRQPLLVVLLDYYYWA